MGVLGRRPERPARDIAPVFARRAPLYSSGGVLLRQTDVAVLCVLMGVVVVLIGVFGFDVSGVSLGLPVDALIGVGVVATQPFLEHLRRGESNGEGRRDVYFLIGRGVSSFARVSVLFAEGPEARDRHFVVLSDTRCYGVEDGFNRFTRRDFRLSEVRRDGVDEITFVHR